MGGESGKPSPKRQAAANANAKVCSEWFCFYNPELDRVILRKGNEMEKGLPPGPENQQNR